MRLHLINVRMGFGRRPINDARLAGVGMIGGRRRMDAVGHVVVGLIQQLIVQRAHGERVDDLCLLHRHLITVHRHRARLVNFFHVELLVR